jgi:hypothetical protein
VNDRLPQNAMIAFDEWDKLLHTEQQPSCSQEGRKSRFDSVSAWAKGACANHRSNIELFRKM